MNEKLQKQEVSVRTEKPSVQKAVPTPTLDAGAVFSARHTMLASIEARISPLLKRALEIKLEHEQKEMKQLAQGESDARSAHAKKQGILNSQFFKKKTLSQGNW